MRVCDGVWMVIGVYRISEEDEGVGSGLNQTEFHEPILGLFEVGLDAAKTNLWSSYV